MALAPGSRFGPYEIVAALGAGGMGEVYRARDGKLQRDVALKLLPDRFMDDPERLVRFEREAQALAALNHPNVAQIFGFLEDQGRHAFVMELVEGRTLDVLIAASKPAGVGLQQACTIAARIADAVEAAHAHGILHRDLKPANVMVTTGSIVKVLDFGLATARASVRPDPTLATITAFTEVGIAIGTPAYMSPEQARGEPVDRRTDVWAFGCLLFEMLTGVRAFDGRTSSDIMAAVLTREPDWSKLPADVPPTLKRLLTRCLQKDTARRLRDLGDARLEIEDSAVPSAIVAAPTSARGARAGRWMAMMAIIATASLMAGYAGWRLREPAAADATLKRFDVALPIDRYETTLNQAGVPFALSPDGSSLVYAAGSQEGSQLFLRLFDSVESTVIPGTLSAVSPFFSPDGQWIAFSRGYALHRVPVRGGPVQKIVDTAQFAITGAVWTIGGIYFPAGANGSEGIARISPDGGTPQLVAVVDKNAGEAAYLWPSVLPDQQSLVYTVRYAASSATAVVLHSLDTGSRRTVLAEGMQARYVNTGHLVYAVGDRLLAVSFDVSRREIVGRPVAIVSLSAGTGTGTARQVMTAAQFAVAHEGTMVFVQGTRADQRSLAWVDRVGRVSRMSAKADAYGYPALTPDGGTIAAVVRSGDQSDLWRYVPGANALTRITFVGRVTPAVWTPDGRALTYASPHQEGVAMYVQNLADSAASELLFTSQGSETGSGGLWPGSWSADGQRLAFMHAASAGGDISLYDRRASGRSAPLISGPATEWGARLSPDGHSLAYVSNESGRWQVYLQALPTPGARVQISADGGTEVVWARNGRELFYRNGPRVIAVAIEPGGGLKIGKTTVLFEGPFAAGQPGLPNYDVAPDGRFVMVEPGPDERTTPQLHVLLNWPALLK